MTSVDKAWNDARMFGTGFFMAQPDGSTHHISLEDIRMIDNIPQRRGSGRTTQQIREAPTSAVFVWCNDGRRWIEDLVRQLGRTDLFLMTPHELETGNFDRLRGQRYSTIIFDHVVRDLGLTPRQWAGYQQLLYGCSPE